MFSQIIEYTFFFSIYFTISTYANDATCLNNLPDPDGIKTKAPAMIRHWADSIRDTLPDGQGPMTSNIIFSLYKEICRSPSMSSYHYTCKPKAKTLSNQRISQRFQIRSQSDFTFQKGPEIMKALSTVKCAVTIHPDAKWNTMVQVPLFGLDYLGWDDGCHADKNIFVCSTSNCNDVDEARKQCLGITKLPETTTIPLTTEPTPPITKQKARRPGKTVVYTHNQTASYPTGSITSSSSEDSTSFTKEPLDPLQKRYQLTRLLALPVSIAILSTFALIIILITVIVLCKRRRYRKHSQYNLIVKHKPYRM